MLRRTTGLVLSVLTVVVVMGLAVYGLRAQANIRQPKPTLGAVKAPTSAPAPLYRQRSRTVSSVGAADNPLPPAKQAYEDRYAQEQALARRAPKDPTAIPAPPQQGDPQPPTGIIENGLGPFSSQDVTIQNQWQDTVSGRWTHVYAGSLAGDPSQGFVQVVEQAADGTKSGRRYLTPRKAGAVRIEAVELVRFKLLSTSGATFTFDLASRTFTDNS